jgi:hypothetical protein
MIMNLLYLFIPATCHGVISLTMTLIIGVLPFPDIVMSFQEEQELPLLLCPDLLEVFGKCSHRLERLLFMHLTLWLLVEQLAHALKT